ncbi:MAG: M1 family aminopeptidase [Gammaproteobacteria bacterium]|nr:M1 family aminopeptidase [Gammaproteobacteria bacterium]MDH3447334.1 M1 family aminopeptidase [Gammaproteobacteria bacterium]
MTRIIAALLYFVSAGLPAQNLPPPLEHVIEIALTPDSGEIRVSDRVTFSGRDEYRFRLAPWLSIDRLALNGVAADLGNSGNDYVLRLPDKGRHVLEFMLRGSIPARSGGDAAASGQYASSGSDGVYLPGWEAWIAHDDEEPVRFRMRVTVPASQRAVATGKLVDEKVGDQTYSATFELAQPGETPSLFAGPYRTSERLSDGLRLRTYFHAELDTLAEPYLDAAEAYIRRFRAEIGDYPYADFHVISAPIPVGLGFPNLTYVGRQVIPLPFMRTRSLAHEVLHNWWGNGVAVDYASGNWAEGLTTYMADYALERDKGEAEARSMRVKWLRDYAALPAQRDQPVRAFRSKQHQASQVIGYNKVAFIFHMLSIEIGQAAFDAGLRRFWSEHRFRTAAWQDLQAAFEQSAGRELGWFFEQWLDRRGAPRLSLGAHRIEQLENGFRTSIEILQPVAGYRFRLPVRLIMPSGFERHEITVSETLTTVEWITDDRPESIHFDPESDVFRLLQQDETPPIIRDITLNPTTSVVIGSADVDFASIARSLVAGIMDVEPRLAQLADVENSSGPLLLITTSDHVGELLVRLGLRPPPELSQVAHTAAAWTARRANGVPLLVVSADNAAGLRALLRPLPHYGGQSYVLFDGGRAQSRGIWPVARGALFRHLSGG